MVLLGIVGWGSIILIGCFIVWVVRVVSSVLFFRNSLLLNFLLIYGEIICIFFMGIFSVFVRLVWY